MLRFERAQQTSGSKTSKKQVPPDSVSIRFSQPGMMKALVASNSALTISGTCGTAELESFDCSSGWTQTFTFEFEGSMILEYSWGDKYLLSQLDL